MSEVVTDELLNRLRDLSALEIDSNEQEVVKKDIKQMIDFIDKIQKFNVQKIDVDNENIVCNVFREDNVVDNNVKMSDSALGKNAPLLEDDYVVVPKTT